ncbi:hypothetical protein ACFU44_13750 [Nocardia rhizosphaerihabitans]|uniref:hypothetical protein n=1 Tax=Nocardia rhizosphaerihabitans TaxID=1691570 RepID=UPI00366BD908
MPNVFNPMKSDTDLANLINQLNSNFAKLDNEAVTKVFYGPGQVPRLIDGRLPNELGYGMLVYDANGIPLIYIASDANGNPVLKVAPPGVDATTAPNSQLIFNSAQNVFKVIWSATATVPLIPLVAVPPDVSSVTVDVDTGLEATLPPAFHAYLQVGSEAYALPHESTNPQSTNTAGVSWSLKASTYVSSGKIHFRLLGQNYSSIADVPSLTVKYYLYQETAQ